MDEELSIFLTNNFFRYLHENEETLGFQWGIMTSPIEMIDGRVIQTHIYNLDQRIDCEITCMMQEAMLTIFNPLFENIINYLRDIFVLHNMKLWIYSLGAHATIYSTLTFTPSRPLYMRLALGSHIIENKYLRKPKKFNLHV